MEGLPLSLQERAVLSEALEFLEQSLTTLLVQEQELIDKAYDQPLSSIVKAVQLVEAKRQLLTDTVQIHEKIKAFRQTTD